MVHLATACNVISKVSWKFFLNISLKSPSAYTTERIQDSLWNNSSVCLDYIKLRTRPNQFEIFE